MKGNGIQIALCIMGFILSSLCAAQDQASYFNGIDQYASFAAPTNMPTGSEDRTIQFWMRADFDNPTTEDQVMLNLGLEQFEASRFGIGLRVDNDTARIHFTGNNLDMVLPEAIIPDDQWHFLTLTYSAPNLVCFIDGEYKSTADMTREGSISTLNTEIGKCYIGANPDLSGFYKGAIDSISVWNDVRSRAEIRRDMVEFPRLTAAEDGLVLHFKFQVGSGTTSSDVRATLSSTSLWAQAIANNPNVIPEGVWFLIQNKSDVDTDFGEPLEGLALKALSNGVRMTLAPIPAEGDYDAFLWRVIADPYNTGKFKLVNKKMGIGKALDSSSDFIKMEDIVNVTGQAWNISNPDVRKKGLNEYTMSNNFISDANSISYANGSIGVARRNTRDAKQAWVLQPMELVSGYHISTTSTTYFRGGKR